MNVFLSFKSRMTISSYGGNSCNCLTVEMAEAKDPALKSNKSFCLSPLLVGIYLTDAGLLIPFCELLSRVSDLQF